MGLFKWWASIDYVRTFIKYVNQLNIENLKQTIEFLAA